jgi:hypothetical protein
LVLRDNQTSAQYPDGIFHPHQDVQHIKKENIGLIEVMGLAILPARLLTELAEVQKYLLDEPNHIADMHKPWADELKATQTWLLTLRKHSCVKPSVKSLPACLKMLVSLNKMTKALPLLIDLSPHYKLNSHPKSIFIDLDGYFNENYCVIWVPKRSYAVACHPSRETFACT